LWSRRESRVQTAPTGLWLGQVWRSKPKRSMCFWALPSSLRPEHHTTACNRCSTSIASLPTLPHTHRHWPPCLPPHRPRRSHSHSALPLAPRQLPKQRSRPLPPTRMISSGPIPRSHTQRGGKQSSRHTRRYIPPEMRGISHGHTKLTRLHRF
jgi:hypothetical protein